MTTRDKNKKPSAPADKSAPRVESEEPGEYHTSAPARPRRELSYDGRGINGPDEYRSRIATFTSDAAGDKYGKLFEAAPEFLAALRNIRGACSQWACNRLEAAAALENIGDFANIALDKFEQ